MPVDKQQLFSLLEAIDESLSARIRINAVGGTALTLLGLKASTIDVDFDMNKNDYVVLRKTLDALQPGYRIDLFAEGMIFSQQLPEDYLSKCVEIRKLEKIDLYSIAPIDIVASKIGRLNERDIQDIKQILKHYRLTKRQVKLRASKIGYAGNDENYQHNLNYVLTRLFE